MLQWISGAWVQANMYAHSRSPLLRKNYIEDLSWSIPNPEYTKRSGSQGMTRFIFLQT